MTLQTLEYVIEIARRKSFSQAARSLYMSQSALSAAVKDLEDELGIQIFIRTNKGVILTTEGEDCLTYAKDILARSNLLALRYRDQKIQLTSFSVSCQHLPYAVRAFETLAAELDPTGYDIAIRETATSRVLYDVSTERSELGILALYSNHISLMNKVFQNYNLEFKEVGRLKTYAFFRKDHPLAVHSSVTIDQLRDYPFVTYDQEDAAGYQTEEALLEVPMARQIRVSDRATKMLLLRNSDAFSIGVDLTNYNHDVYFSNKSTELIAVPIEDYKEPIITGYVCRRDHPVSEPGTSYLQYLEVQVKKIADSR
ncbi:MAG: LysR family transcriptional regulator [Lachnospiraceae bacterium]|nr:LysR family transcriptional regulator [Lachnospiraceae bacterium]